MARVLILELDPVFAAVLEDRLLVAGHEPTLATDPALAVSTATEGQADLLIMEMELPTVSGIEIVRQLRQQGETRSLPILALSASATSSDRIAALRAGVDEYLALPCDPEEMMLRLDRLLGIRGVAAPVMEGDLASHSIWELLQYIEQADKSGDLVIQGKRGSGKVRIERGRVVSARWGRLRGRDAVLALADTKEGRFRLTTRDAGGEGTPATDSLLLPEVLIQAAWIEDQLAKRRAYLPATGAEVNLAADTLPPIEEAFAFLPIERIFRHLRRTRGARVYDLVAAGDDAPSKVRLALAWLGEKRVLVPVEQSQSPMSTGEIDSAVVLDVAVYSLLSKARDGGFDVSALPYLLLGEPGVWSDLQQLPANVPGFLRIEALRSLVERTQDGSGGSTTLEVELGKLSLHMQPLTAAVRQQVEAIVPVCAGVLLWLHDVADRDLVRRVVDRLEAARGSAVGLIVACTPAARKAASELTADTIKWRVSNHAPQSLLGVFRLLQTPAG